VTLIRYTRVIETIGFESDAADAELMDPVYDSVETYDDLRDLLRELESFDCANPGGSGVYQYDAEQNYRTGEYTRESLHPIHNDPANERNFWRAVKLAGAIARNRRNNERYLYA